MPLPLIPIILGGASILAGVAGVGGALSGKEKMDKAKSRIDDAKEEYERKKGEFDEIQEFSTEILSDLGKTKLEIREDFKRFCDVFERIHNRPEVRDIQGERFKFTSVDLRNIRQSSISAGEAIGSIMGAIAAGTITAGAAWSAVGLLGAASTGTAIASLHGVAATNALLAWFGGGSLAAGGLGMAGGAAVLGGLFLGPLVFATGWFVDSKGDDALAKARETENEVDSACEKMDTAITFFEIISDLACDLMSELERAKRFYDKKVSQLERLVNRCNDYNSFSNYEKILLDNNIMLVKILSDMTEADLLTKNNKGEPVMEISAIRDEEIDCIIKESEDTLTKIAKHKFSDFLISWLHL